MYSSVQQNSRLTSMNSMGYPTHPNQFSVRAFKAPPIGPYYTTPKHELGYHSGGVSDYYNTPRYAPTTTDSHRSTKYPPLRTDSGPHGYNSRTTTQQPSYSTYRENTRNAYVYEQSDFDSEYGDTATNASYSPTQDSEFSPAMSTDSLVTFKSPLPSPLRENNTSSTRRNSMSGSAPPLQTGPTTERSYPFSRHEGILRSGDGTHIRSTSIPNHPNNPIPIPPSNSSHTVSSRSSGTYPSAPPTSAYTWHHAIPTIPPSEAGTEDVSFEARRNAEHNAISSSSYYTSESDSSAGHLTPVPLNHERNLPQQVPFPRSDNTRPYDAVVQPSSYESSSIHDLNSSMDSSAMVESLEEGRGPAYLRHSGSRELRDNELFIPPLGNDEWMSTRERKDSGQGGHRRPPLSRGGPEIQRDYTTGTIAHSVISSTHATYHSSPPRASPKAGETEQPQPTPPSASTSTSRQRRNSGAAETELPQPVPPPPMASTSRQRRNSGAAETDLPKPQSQSVPPPPSASATRQQRNSGAAETEQVQSVPPTSTSTSTSRKRRNSRAPLPQTEVTTPMPVPPEKHDKITSPRLSPSRREEVKLEQVPIPLSESVLGLHIPEAPLPQTHITNIYAPSDSQLSQNSPPKRSGESSQRIGIDRYGTRLSPPLASSSTYNHGILRPPSTTPNPTTTTPNGVYHSYDSSPPPMNTYRSGYSSDISRQTPRSQHTTSSSHVIEDPYRPSAGPGPGSSYHPIQNNSSSSYYPNDSHARRMNTTSAATATATTGYPLMTNIIPSTSYSTPTSTATTATTTTTTTTAAATMMRSRKDSNSWSSRKDGLGNTMVIPSTSTNVSKTPSPPSRYAQSQGQIQRPSSRSNSPVRMDGRRGHGQNVRPNSVVYEDVQQRERERERDRDLRYTSGPTPGPTPGQPIYTTVLTSSPKGMNTNSPPQSHSRNSPQQQYQNQSHDKPVLTVRNPSPPSESSTETDLNLNRDYIQTQTQSQLGAGVGGLGQGQSQGQSQGQGSRSYTPFPAPSRRHTASSSNDYLRQQSQVQFQSQLPPTQTQVHGHGHGHGEPVPKRRYSDGDQNEGPSFSINTGGMGMGMGMGRGGLGRCVRWNDNLVCPSPVPLNRRKGWFNRRGDQLWTNEGAYKPTLPGDEYPPDLDDYPEFGYGWMNEEGVRIDMEHRLVPKVPLRSALKQPKQIC